VLIDAAPDVVINPFSVPAEPGVDNGGELGWKDQRRGNMEPRVVDPDLREERLGGIAHELEGDSDDADDGVDGVSACSCCPASRAEDTSGVGALGRASICLFWISSSLRDFSRTTIE